MARISPCWLFYLTNPLTIAYLRKQCNDLGKREVASSPSAAKGIRTFDNTSPTTSVTLNFGERLSEKGYERRSDGRFLAGIQEVERTDRFLFGCSQGYTVVSPRLSDGFSR